MITVAFILFGVAGLVFLLGFLTAKDSDIIIASAISLFIVSAGLIFLFSGKYLNSRGRPIVCDQGYYEVISMAKGTEKDGKEVYEKTYFFVRGGSGTYLLCKAGKVNLDLARPWPRMVRFEDNEKVYEVEKAPVTP